MEETATSLSQCVQRQTCCRVGPQIAADSTGIDFAAVPCCLLGGLGTLGLRNASTARRRCSSAAAAATGLLGRSDSASRANMQSVINKLLNTNAVDTILLFHVLLHSAYRRKGRHTLRLSRIVQELQRLGCQLRWLSRTGQQEL